MTLPRTQVLLAATGALAIGAAVGRLQLDSMNDADGPSLSALAANADPDAPQVPEVAASRPDRLVLVVLDGLGEAPFLEALEHASVTDWHWRATVDVGTPSLSRPVYHVLLSGVPQAVSGIRNNAHRGPARADDLAARVRATGGTVGWALEGVPWFHDLFGRPEDVYERPAAGAGPYAFMARVLNGSPRLAVLHFVRIDMAGHAHGATSAEYGREADQAARAVVALRAAHAGTPEGARTVWMLGADHGHLARGGHGGPELDVVRTTWVGLWPSPIERRVRVPGVVPADRLAATFAALLGVPPPATAMGDPLELPDRPSRASEATEGRRAAVEKVLGESTRRGRRGAMARAALLALALVGLGAVLVRRGRVPGGPDGTERDSRPGRAAQALVGALLPTLGACLGFWLLGPGMTLSAIRNHLGFLTQSTGAMALGAALGALLGRRWGAPLGWMFIASAAVPGAAHAITAGSMGRSMMPDELLLSFPAAGIVPWGVVIGAIVVGSLAVLFGRYGKNARTRVAQSAQGGAASLRKS